MSPVKRAGEDSDSEISDESVGGLSASDSATKNNDWFPRIGFPGKLNFEPSADVTQSINTSSYEAGRAEKSHGEDAVWYAVNQEAEALFYSAGRGRASRSNTHRGKRHSNAFGEEKSRSVRECSYTSDHEELESDDEYSLGDENGIKHSEDAVSESFQPEKKMRIGVSEITVLGCFAESSAVELLENLQNKTILPEDDPDKYARYENRPILSEKKKSLFTLGDRSLNNEDSSEPICTTSSSDDNDESKPNLRIVVAEATKKTIVDRFQEAIGTSILNDQGMQYAFSKPLGLGLSGKLQQVMREEKDQDARFLKMQQSIEQTHDEVNCLDVKILSRYLEGKLVVCRCSLIDHKEGLVDIPEPVEESKDNERLLIFNFRICNYVDLDVGNCVRVHPPWKEVTTGCYGMIILCSYFSQI